MKGAIKERGVDGGDDNRVHLKKKKKPFLLRKRSDSLRFNLSPGHF